MVDRLKLIKIKIYLVFLVFLFEFLGVVSRLIGIFFYFSLEISNLKVFFY